MEQPFVITLAKYSNIAAFSFTWTFTLILLYLILKKTEKQMLKYSKILLHSAILDLISTCAFTFCQTQLEFKGSYFFTRSGSFLPTFEGKMKCVYPMLYGLFYNLSFLPIPLQSIYRYFCIYRNQQIPMWFIISIYLGILGLLIPSGYWYVVVFDPITTSPEGIAALKTLPFWSNATGIERFCVSKLANPGIYVYCLFLNLIAFIGLFSIIYTSYKTYGHLRSHKFQMSPKTLQMQYQLGKRLILQTILPFLFALNTIFLCSAPYILPDYSGGLFLFLFLPYPWQGVINCVVTVISIKSYWLTIFSWLQCQGFRNANSGSGNMIWSGSRNIVVSPIN